MKDDAYVQVRMQRSTHAQLTALARKLFNVYGKHPKRAPDYWPNIPSLSATVQVLLDQRGRRHKQTY